jgi:hypothetical protein
VNGQTDSTAHGHAARIARIAWLCAYVVPLVLATLLLGVKSAQAEPLGPDRVPFAFEEELALEDELGPEDEGDFAVEECEFAEEEGEEGELGALEVDQICLEAEEEAQRASGSKAGNAPEECILRSANGHATVDEKSHKLKLTLGYTTYEPAAATVKVGHLATLRRHLGRSGVLRLAKNVGEKSPKRLTVRIKVPGAPGYCGKYQVEKVKVR